MTDLFNLTFEYMNKISMFEINGVKCALDEWEWKSQNYYQIFHEHVNYSIKNDNLHHKCVDCDGKEAFQWHLTDSEFPHICIIKR